MTGLFCCEFIWVRESYILTLVFKAINMDFRLTNIKFRMIKLFQISFFPFGTS